MADLYDVLGVPPDAPPDEIKRAYRRLARELHPDANPDDPRAEARFKEVAHAYEVLADPQRRQRYDTFGDDGGASPDPGFGGGFGLGDIFDAFFQNTGFAGQPGPGGPPGGPDLEAVVELSLEEVVAGAQAPVTVRTAVRCPDCDGSGAEPGSTPTTCPDCGGAGQVRRVRQSILGQMVTAGPCPRCNALGTVVDRPCPGCAGEGRVVQDETYQVEIPAGIEDGRALRLQGRGAAGPRGGRNGDLYLHVRVRPHARFVRSGNDLVHELHVTMTQAALGTSVVLETFDGSEEIVVDPGTQTGRVIRCRHLGVPYVQGRGRGDLLVHVIVDTPVGLTAEEDEALRAFAALRGEEVSPPGDGLFSRIRSAFK